MKWDSRHILKLTPGKFLWPIIDTFFLKNFFFCKDHRHLLELSIWGNRCAGMLWWIDRITMQQAMGEFQNASQHLKQLWNWSRRGYFFFNINILRDRGLFSWLNSRNLNFEHQNISKLGGQLEWGPMQTPIYFCIHYALLGFGH